MCVVLFLKGFILLPSALPICDSLRMKYLRLLLILPMLAGCGRKPTVLQAPDEDVAEGYPQVYPKPQPGEVPARMPQSDLANKYKARPEQALQ
jgi:predicted small lipoprotein YifL